MEDFEENNRSIRTLQWPATAPYKGSNDIAMWGVSSAGKEGLLHIKEKSCDHKLIVYILPECQLQYWKKLSNVFNIKIQ